MPTYLDPNPGGRADAPPEREPQPPVTPAELLTPGQAAERVYERGSIAETIQRMFREADEMAAQGVGYETSEYWSREYPADTEAFRRFMRGVQAELRNSAIVRELRVALENGREITVQNIKDVFTAYERAIQASLMKLRDELSPAQLAQLRHSAQSDLDWSYRDLLIDRIAAGDNDVRTSVQDFFLILNPKARKIQYMDKREILATLKHSMAQASTDQLKRDLQVVHRREDLPAVQQLQSEPDYPQLEQAIH